MNRKRSKFVVKGRSTEPLSDELVYERLHNVLTKANFDLSYLTVEDDSDSE